MLYRNDTSARLVEFLSSHGLLFREYWLLDQLSHTPLPPDVLLRRSVAEAERHGEGPWRISMADAEHGIASLMQSLLVTTIGQQQLLLLYDDVSSKRLLGPYDRFPFHGEIDVTRAGADVVLQLTHTVFGDAFRDCNCRHDVDDTHIEVVGTTKAGVVDFVEEIMSEENVESVSPIKEIGRWCSLWWVEYPRGYLQLVTLAKTSNA